MPNSGSTGRFKKRSISLKKSLTSFDGSHLKLTLVIAPFMAITSTIMQAIFEFDLETPEDRVDFAIMSKAKELLFTIRELDEDMRRRFKYEDQDTIHIEEVRRLLWESIKEYGLSEIMDL